MEDLKFTLLGGIVIVPLLVFCFMLPNMIKYIFVVLVITVAVVVIGVLCHALGESVYDSWRIGWLSDVRYLIYEIKTKFKGDEDAS